MRALLTLPFLLAACGDATQENPSPTPVFDAAVTDTARADIATSVDDTGSATDSAVVVDSEIADDTRTPPTDAAGSFCGGIAGKMCATGYYCFMETGRCSVPDAGGTCSPIPSGCTKELNPVCGCDGKTYNNPCMAAAAGANVAKTGSCTTTSMCGTATCAPTTYCEYGTGCSGPGLCKPRPDICPGIYDPVCGCDGKTYSNDCAARAAGTDYASKGACSK